MAETGKKMGDYTPLESNKKEYFFGDGEGGVVAVGKTEAAGSKTNRLVKLSDIAGDKLPSGGTEGQVLTKTANGEAWAAVPTELPSSGSAGQFLKKTASGVEYASVNEVPSGGTAGQVLTKTASGNEWANAPKELPTSGSEGQFLKKTANGVEYASVNEVPSGGTTGQVLTKTASGEAWADAPKELPTSGTAGQFLKKTANGVEYASVNQVPTSGMTGDVLKKTASGYEFSDANEVPANGTEGDVLTKGAEGYSWAPRMLYKYDTKSEGDTVEITNKTITRMNIDVHSATTFNITTDDVTNMPNAIVEIFVDQGTSLTEIAFTLTWTITSGDYAGVRTLYCPASGNTVQVNAGDVLQIHIYNSCWNAFRFIQAVSPTPSYEYVILQNFVAGHSIGTPSAGALVTTVPGDWYDDLYQWGNNLTMFTDTSEGATLIDNRSPIDCSKYGINSGTPVATLNCDPEYGSVFAGFNIDNGNLSYPLTAETFFTCREPDRMNSHFIMIIGNNKPTVQDDANDLFIGLCLSNGTYEDYKYCRVYLTNNHKTYHRIANFNPDEVGEPDGQGQIPAGKIGMTTWLNSWHHFAFTIDTSNLYVFVDGKCYATIPLSNTYANEGAGGTHAGGITKTLGEWIALMPSKACITSAENADSEASMAGLWAQFAVCKACKWTTDFTVPTEAY